MPKSDKEFTRVAGDLLVNVRDLVNWGIETGNTTPELMRNSVFGRKLIAQKMHESGVSLRKIAKALECHVETIRRDLGSSQNATKSVAKSDTRTAHEEIAKFAFNQQAKNVPTGDPIRHGDFYELSKELKSDSVDLVFTDPPYDNESIPLFGQMGEVAHRVLKPGGSLITYCGHMQVLDAGNLLSKHLRFWQPLCCLHSGPAARLTEYGVVASFKPMLWFVKGTRSDKHTFIDNVVTGQREKDHHDWQQAESEAAYFIEMLSPPSGFVVDFFCGGATTIAAAMRLDRSAIGYEKDAVRYAAGLKRIVA